MCKTCTRTMYMYLMLKLFEHLEIFGENIFFDFYLMNKITLVGYAVIYFSPVLSPSPAGALLPLL